MVFKQRSGFTLLELLVVIIIIGVLAAAAIPSFGNSAERGRCREAQTTLQIIFQAQRIFRLDNGAFGTLADLTGRGYMPSPNPNVNWNFTIPANAATTFTATATRTGGGFNGNTISLDEQFTNAPNAAYGGRVYAGNHPLRD